MVYFDVELNKKSIVETRRQDDTQKRLAQLSPNPRFINYVHARVGILSSFHRRALILQDVKECGRTNKVSPLPEKATVRVKLIWNQATFFVPRFVYNN